MIVHILCTIIKMWHYESTYDIMRQRATSWINILYDIIRQRTTPWTNGQHCQPTTLWIHRRHHESTDSRHLSTTSWFNIRHQWLNVQQQWKQRSDGSGESEANSKKESKRRSIDPGLMHKYNSSGRRNTAVDSFLRWTTGRRGFHLHKHTAVSQMLFFPALVWTEPAQIMLLHCHYFAIAVGAKGPAWRPRGVCLMCPTSR